MVRVTPCRLPAKVIVAPNSPSALAQHSTAPATRAGRISGSVTRRKTVSRFAPRVAAASSYPWSAERKAPSTAMTRNGIATNVSAITTAAVVNGMVMPNHASRRSPTSPLRPRTSSSATPPTTGGSTSGNVTSARRSRSPGIVDRASTQASGTPRTSEMSIASVAVSSESQRASSTSSVPRTWVRSPHGARTSSPSRGTTSSSAPTSAGTPSAHGVRCVRVVTAGASRSGEAGGGQQLRAVVGEHEVDELLRLLLVRGVLQAGDRVGGRRVLVVRDLDALDLPACRSHVGHVDHAGVHLTERDLGEHRLHVDLLGRRLQVESELVEEDGGGQLAARHLGLADRDLDALTDQVAHCHDP